MQTTVSINKAGFRSLEEGRIATVDRILMASALGVTHEALKSLIFLTAMACGSDNALAMSVRACEIDELEAKRFIERVSPDTVVLL